MLVYPSSLLSTVGSAGTLLLTPQADTLLLTPQADTLLSYHPRLAPYCPILAGTLLLRPLWLVPYYYPFPPASTLLLITVVFRRTWVLRLATHTLSPELIILTPSAGFLRSVCLECLFPLPPGLV